jgi:hypothetical protein
VDPEKKPEDMLCLKILEVLADPATTAIHHHFPSGQVESSQLIFVARKHPQTLQRSLSGKKCGQD